MLNKNQTDEKSLTLDTSSSNAHVSNGNKELFSKTRVPYTPFDIVTIHDRDENDNSFIALGQYRLTDYQGYKDCLDAIESRDWELLINTFGVAIDQEMNQLEARIMNRLQNNNDNQ